MELLESNKSLFLATFSVQAYPHLKVLDVFIIKILVDSVGGNSDHQTTMKGGSEVCGEKES
ncbi:MAG: hypothetical protein ACI945_000500 [Pseudohongiellaceae bacterium]|jgi:hypothetical protein